MSVPCIIICRLVFLYLISRTCERDESKYGIAKVQATSRYKLQKRGNRKVRVIVAFCTHVTSVDSSVRRIGGRECDSAPSAEFDGDICVL